LGARATYKSAFIGKSNCEITLAARNIFSKTYIAFSEPDPGGNSYQPGAPLEVFLNVKIGSKIEIIHQCETSQHFDRIVLKYIFIHFSSMLQKEGLMVLLLL